MNEYNHQEIEKKWQKVWTGQNIYRTREDKGRPKFYILDMFPYPSGVGLHVGHPKGYIATDIFGRAKSMQGYNVLHPMGWDAFGLPAENYAIQNKVHPRQATEENIKTFKNQLAILGFTYDWEREINTTDPAYYKWTQWAFIQMFKKGLAYESYEPINWCPSCKTGLANEDLENGLCERCGSEVERKPIRQWVLKITDYADRLLNDLEKLPDWEESIKEMQRNWIGRSEGVEIEFKIKNNGEQQYNPPINWWVNSGDGDVWFFVTFPTYSRGLFFEEQGEAQKIINIFEQIVKEKKYQVADIAVMPEHVHLLVKRGKKDDLEKIVKNLKGISSRLYDQSEEHLWAKSFEYETIENQVDFDKVISYLQNNPIKAGLPKDGRLLSEYRMTTIGGSVDRIKVFTTRPDTLYGATYLVLSPEYAWLNSVSPEYAWLNHQLIGGLTNADEVVAYIEKTKQKTDLARQAEKEKTGVELKGIKAINPVNGDELPIFIADYVLSSYGTGAIMAVPAHDERDFEFAKKFNLPIIPVIKDEDKDKRGTILVIHGLCGNSNENWFPWLKDNAQKIGYEVLVPDLPNADEPKMEEWLSVLAGLKEKLVGEIIVIGHSLGAAVACKFVEENNLKINKLILVAPTGSSQGEDNWQALKSAGVTDSGIQAIKDFNGVKIDWKNLQSLIESPFICMSDNDPYIPLEVQNDYKGINPAIRIFSNCGHFNQKAGFIKFPELMAEIMDGAYVGKGGLVNSGEFDGMEVDEAKKKITKKVGGKLTVQYKLRDWVFSRQRYWGEPIPLVKCDKCGWVAVPEKDLPVELPDVRFYEPTGTGESPLANITDWVNTTCPECGGPAKRETNTMPQWAGSSWYYLRYIDPHNDTALVDKKKEKYWSPVDFYVGGAEHATRHLIYARFWHKFLYDIGAVNYDEPFKRLQHVGLILAEDGRKMSKRWGNVINPNDIVRDYGADAMRVYEMFMGPFSQPCAWSTDGLVGARRFLVKIWKLQDKVKETEIEKLEIKKLVHKTIKKVTEDIENFRFNTAISAMMILVNEMEKEESISAANFQFLISILSPFAPHICEELWQKLGHIDSITVRPWPKYDEKLIVDDVVSLVVQVNGKLRENIEVAKDITEKEATELVLASEKIQKWLEGKTPKKIIFVPGKLINIVV
ncbi:MAG: alpha/beta fold hydrolase [Patescibacteria group bacterium]|jgi:leucyl-tRNA synthetase